MITREDIVGIIDSRTLHRKDLEIVDDLGTLAQYVLENVPERKEEPVELKDFEWHDADGDSGRIEFVGAWCMMYVNDQHVRVSKQTASKLAKLLQAFAEREN